MKKINSWFTYSKSVLVYQRINIVPFPKGPHNPRTMSADRWVRRCRRLGVSVACTFADPRVYRIIHINPWIIHWILGLSFTVSDSFRVIHPSTSGLWSSLLLELVCLYLPLFLTSACNLDQFSIISPHMVVEFAVVRHHADPPDARNCLVLRPFGFGHALPHNSRMRQDGLGK